MDVQPRRHMLHLSLAVLGLGLGLLQAHGQTPSAPSPPTPPPSAGDERSAAPPASGLPLAEGRSGYIDPALVGRQLRLRFDAAYRNPRPNRAEFFYAAGPPLGNGPAQGERSVDYQEWQLFYEHPLGERFSTFFEAPLRLLNPELNPNALGVGDLNAGAKWTFLDYGDLLGTFQLRGFFPTGDAGRGLGTDHVSLEPGLLTHWRLSESWALDAELRYWQPLGGSVLAGPVLRYGLGASWTPVQTSGLRAGPVVEFVGWQILDGGKTAAAAIESAAGDAILNAKFGLRAGFEAWDAYLGYGRALTGDRWYQDVLRLEVRWLF